MYAPAPTDVTVGYKIAGSTINGADHASLSGTNKKISGTFIGAKTIKAGEILVKINVEPTGDLDGAAMKTVTLILAPGSAYTVDASPDAKVGILGNG